MSDAIAKPSKRKGPDPREDAFLRFVNRVVDWTQENVRALVAGGALLVLLAGAAFWYVSYTRNREREASSRLQRIESALLTGADTVGVDRLQSFLGQYDGTDAARQARLLLARLHVRRGDGEQAVEAARPAADRPADTPEGYAGRMLLAKAQEAAGRPEAALRTLERLAEGARFGFQRREATARRAEILVDMGRLAEAEAVYEDLVESSEGADAEERYAVRLGEVRALRAAGGAEASRSGDGGGEGGNSPS